MKVRINTNEKISDAQKILLRQIDAINDKYDAIEICKALAVRYEDFENNTVTTLHSDRVFRKLLLLINSKNYIKSTKGVGDQYSDSVEETVRVSLEKGRVLSITFVHTHRYESNTHIYRFYTSVYDIDYDLSFEDIDIQDLIDKIFETYKLSEIIDPRDNQGSSRKRV